MTKSKILRTPVFSYYAIVHNGTVIKFPAGGNVNQGNARRNMTQSIYYPGFGLKVSRDQFGNDVVSMTGFRAEQTGFHFQLSAGRMPQVNADELCIVMHNIIDDYLSVMKQKGIEVLSA